MVIGGYRYCPVKGLIIIGEVADIGQGQTDAELELLRVSAGKAEHFRGKISAIQLKAGLEGEKVRSVSTAQVEQSPFLPPPGHLIQLTAEDRPVAEVIPPRGNLVKDVCCHQLQSVKLSLLGSIL